jgi:acyl-CoA thioesterase FadM
MSGEPSAHAGLHVGWPRYEGANIRTWIGFKHLLYLVEESLLRFLRRQGLGPHRLFLEHGVGLQIVDFSVQLPRPVYIDDEITAEVREQTPARYRVTLRALRGSEDPVVVRARVTIALIEEPAAPGSAPLPGRFRAFAVPSTSALGAGEDIQLAPATDARTALAAAHAGATTWTWRARYFHCHYSDRVQHSAYVRALEEVVDRFLTERGLSVRTMLESRGWVPVVSHARVRLFADAHMEDDIHTCFMAGEIIKDAAYDGRMECYVERGGQLVHVSTGEILHGYVHSDGARAGALVTLDERTKAALRGPGHE